MSNGSSNPENAVVALDEKPHGRTPWHVLTAVIVLVVAFLVSQLISALLVAMYPHLRGWSSAYAGQWLNSSIGAQFAYVLFSETLLVGGLYGFVRWRKGSLRTLGVQKPRWIDVGFAGVGVLSYLGLYFVAVAVVSSLINLNVNQQQDLGFSNPIGGAALVLTFISLVVLPPLAEEFAFRGFLFTTLRGRFGFVWAMLGTSALFAVPHLLESSGGGLLWIAGVDTFVLSFVLCYVRQKTGRLWAGVGIHMVKNLIAFISLYVLHVH